MTTEQPSATPGPTVVENTDRARFEIYVGVDLAGFATYELKDGDAGPGTVVAILHTEIGEAFAGQGLAKELATQVLDGLRADGRQLLPYCPFFTKFVQKNPEYADLVPAARHEQFGL